MSFVKPNGSSDTFYQGRDKEFRVGVFFDGVKQPLSGFSGAEYVIARPNGTRLVVKTLGNGLSLDLEVDDFIVDVDDLDLPSFGQFIHQFTPIDLDGNILDPIWQRKLTVKRTY